MKKKKKIMYFLSLKELPLNLQKLSEREKGNLLENSWKINHKFRPPTVEEFLTEDWIGPQAKEVFPHCRDVFIKYFDPSVNKNTLITYCCT